jgi:5-formyltetrahydrofolate cyclo-ligase
MPKRSIRRTMLEHRRALTLEECRTASLAIQQTFLDSDEYGTSRVLVIYSAIHNEVDTQSIMQHAWNDGKCIAFPAVVGHTLAFQEVKAVSSLQEGAFGILEPCPTCRKFSPDEIDVFIVPGVAFDLNGYRVGYGKGYYDRTLHRMENLGRLVGVCYDFQLVEKIVGEPHDVQMDIIITEKRIIRRQTT